MPKTGMTEFWNSWLSSLTGKSWDLESWAHFLFVRGGHGDWGWMSCTVAHTAGSVKLTAASYIQPDCDVLLARMRPSVTNRNRISKREGKRSGVFEPAGEEGETRDTVRRNMTLNGNARWNGNTSLSTIWKFPVWSIKKSPPPFVFANNSLLNPPVFVYVPSEMAEALFLDWALGTQENMHGWEAQRWKSRERSILGSTGE